MIYAIVAALLFGIADVFTKIATVRLNTARIVLLNALLTLPVAAVFFLILGGSLPQGQYLIRAIIIQGVSALSFIFFFLAMLSGPVSVISPIVSGYSVISIIGGVIFLREMPTAVQFAGIAMIVIGSISICIEPDIKKRNIKDKMWIIWTVMAMFCFGIWSLVSKTLTAHIEPWTMTLIFGIIAPFIWTPYILMRWGREKATLRDIKGIIAGASAVVMTTAAAISYYMALSKLPVSIASPVTGAHPIITVFASLILLKEKFYKFQFISFALILAGLYLLR